MKKKILIIDDEKGDFNRIKAWLERDDKYRDHIIPSDFSSLEAAQDSNQGGQGLLQFAKDQIDKHYKEIGLILCDIKIGEYEKGGHDIVQGIRDYRQLSPHYWTSMVPIFGMTKYSDKQNNQGDNNLEYNQTNGKRTNEPSMVDAGADYVFKKQIIFKEEKDENDLIEEEKLKSIIDMQIRKFEKNLNSFYPHDIEFDIEGFKNRWNQRRNVFIMTSFRKEHLSYAKRIIGVLNNHNIKGHIANAEGGESSDVMWRNVQIHIHGCDFGIGIYADDSILDTATDRDTLKERIRINPNLSQEVGYMLGIHKKVCILKHEDLPKINSDLAEKIYVKFNNDNLEEKLEKWLLDQHLIDRNSLVYLLI